MKKRYVFISQSTNLSTHPITSLCLYLVWNWILLSNWWMDVLYCLRCMIWPVLVRNNLPHPLVGNKKTAKSQNWRRKCYDWMKNGRHWNNNAGRVIWWNQRWIMCLHVFHMTSLFSIRKVFECKVCNNLRQPPWNNLPPPPISTPTTYLLHI